MRLGLRPPRWGKSEVGAPKRSGPLVLGGPSTVRSGWLLNVMCRTGSELVKGGPTTAGYAEPVKGGT